MKRAKALKPLVQQLLSLLDPEVRRYCPCCGELIQSDPLTQDTLDQLAVAVKSPEPVEEVTV